MSLSESKRKQIEEEEKYRAKMISKYHSPLVGRKNKSRAIAALLALIFGGIGIHKFYLGRVGWGIIYFIFSWTFIPALIGFVEGFIYLTMSDKAFEGKYS